MIVFTLAILPALGHHWRTPRYALTVAAALAVAAPLVALWPLLLSMSGPGNLQPWLANAMASRWTDPLAYEGGEMLYFARLLPWYAWPAWPLAAWALYRSRHKLRERRELMLPLGTFIAFFLVASVMGEARDANAMPLLVPLVILGAAELDSLPRGAASALDWFGTMTFLSLAAIIWIGFFAATTGQPAAALAWITKEVPDFKYRFSFLSCALASLLTLIWVVVVARSLRSTRRAIVNWAAGITMSWMLMMTLGLPLVEQARSYRDLSARVVRALPPDFRCIARQNVGDAQRALLDYFANITTTPVEMPASIACNALIVQAAPSKVPAVNPEWEEVWRGSRPGDRHELFILYRRIATPDAPRPARSSA
jgi:hypothetical protein